MRRAIFEFAASSTSISGWRAVNDVVMGGCSQSGLSHSSEGAVFAGNVSTKQSGGFASVRSASFQPPLDVSASTGFEIRVKGDGNRYKFFVRTNDDRDAPAYSFPFETVADTWICVQVPLVEMKAVRRAKTLPDAPPVDAKGILSIQLMISKFEYDGELNSYFTEGDFSLTIASIMTY